MPEPNPYQPPNSDAIKERLQLASRDSCPLCGKAISPWRIWMAVTWEPCEGCNAKLGLEPPPLFRLVLIIFGLMVTVGCAVFSERTSIPFVYLFWLVPIVMSAFSCWMQISFGTIIAKATEL